MQTDNILIAEDDELLGDVWLRAFRTADYTVNLVSDGEEAINWLKDNPLPVALITDYNMPLKNGKAVLRFLDEIDKERAVVRVLITANHVILDDETEKLTDLFLVKPVRIKDMLGLLDRLIDRSD